MKFEKWKLNLYPKTYDLGKPMERRVMKFAGNFIIDFHPTKVSLGLYEIVNSRIFFLGEVS